MLTKRTHLFIMASSSLLVGLLICSCRRDAGPASARGEGVESVESRIDQLERQVALLEKNQEGLLERDKELLAVVDSVLATDPDPQDPWIIKSMNMTSDAPLLAAKWGLNWRDYLAKYLREIQNYRRPGRTRTGGEK